MTEHAKVTANPDATPQKAISHCATRDGGAVRSRRKPPNTPTVGNHTHGRAVDHEDGHGNNTGGHVRTR